MCESGVSCHGSDRRSVRFARNLVQTVVTISRFDMSKEEQASLWWSEDEYEENNKRAQAVILYTHKQGKDFVRMTLDCVFEVSVNVASPPSGSQAEIQAEANEPLVNWMVHCQGRRGLERYISKRRFKCRGVFDHREAVLALGAANFSPEEIALASFQCSAVSRVYARMLGIGDEFVANRLS
jgi:hypothetical protein